MANSSDEKKNGALPRLDPVCMVIPFAAIFALCACFVTAPDASRNVLEVIRAFFGDTVGLWYLIVGLGVFLLSLYMAFSRYGSVLLGKEGEKPRYSNFAWASMMFTSGLAADILFYSICEWILYAEDPHLADMGSIQEWSGTYPLFHWGPIPWSFYLVLACAFGYMLHVRGGYRQKYSEACRPLLGKHTDGAAGRVIDLIALFALLAGTATTFSLATPLMSQILADLFHVNNSKWLSVFLLALTCLIYTIAVVRGMKGVLRLASSCVYLFLTLLAYVLIFGGETRYILETGFSSLGNLMQNFFSLSTYTDPLRENYFPQNWTIFYWAYWMVWCIASPFFIGNISRGRTVKQTILGGYIAALGGTFTSFIILGNYSLGLQVSGKLDVIGIYRQNGDLYATISAVLHTLPLTVPVLILLLVTMIAFYATSFDAITLVASSYSYRFIPEGAEPSMKVKMFWALMLILLPMALLESENSMANLQTVSIIAAFPISLILILIMAAFFKDVKGNVTKA